MPGGSYRRRLSAPGAHRCRRAERLLFTLRDDEAISHDAVRYVNRLSDALFVWSRWINHALGTPEHLWNAETAPPEVSGTTP